MLKSKIHRAAVTGLRSRLRREHHDSISERAHKVTVASFGAYDEADLDSYAPIVVHVGERNEIVRVDSHPEVLLDSSLASEADFEVPGNLIHEGSYR